MNMVEEETSLVVADNNKPAILKNPLKDPDFIENTLFIKNLHGIPLYYLTGKLSYFLGKDEFFIMRDTDVHPEADENHLEVLKKIWQNYGFSSSSKRFLNQVNEQLGEHKKSKCKPLALVFQKTPLFLVTGSFLATDNCEFLNSLEQYELICRHLNKITFHNNF